MFLRLVRRIAIKFLLAEGCYFRRKLSLIPMVVGPPERVTIEPGADLQDAILNVNSGLINIGKDSFCGHGVMILTGTHNPDFFGRERQQDHPKEGFDIKIGCGVWIGSGAILLGGIEICDHSVIAAGAIVTKSILQPGIYAGCPAKLVRPLHETLK
jgi:acetyltransferase-like isoleucine patch superfamily enzyme